MTLDVEPDHVFMSCSVGAEAGARAPFREVVM